MDISKLRTVRNYAKTINKSVQWVYKLGEAKKIETVKIDGVIFIKIK